MGSRTNVCRGDLVPDVRPDEKISRDGEGAEHLGSPRSPFSKGPSTSTSRPEAKPRTQPRRGRSRLTFTDTPLGS